MLAREIRTLLAEWRDTHLARAAIVWARIAPTELPCARAHAAVC
jgi:hypothetical protein